MYFTDAYYVSPGARAKGYATWDELPKKLDALPGILREGLGGRCRASDLHHGGGSGRSG